MRTPSPRRSEPPVVAREAGAGTGIAARLVLALIRIYQLTLSAFMGRHCRYLPTCSEYASDAVRLHGAWAGLWLGLARIQRCRPGGGDGFDPVPETLNVNACWYLPWRYGVWRMTGRDHSTSS